MSYSHQEKKKHTSYFPLCYEEEKKGAEMSGRSGGTFLSERKVEKKGRRKEVYDPRSKGGEGWKNASIHSLRPAGRGKGEKREWERTARFKRMAGDYPVERREAKKREEEKKRSRE